MTARENESKRGRNKDTRRKRKGKGKGKRKRKKNRKRKKDLLATGLFPKYPQQSRLGKVKTKQHELQLGIHISGTDSSLSQKLSFSKSE